MHTDKQIYLVKAPERGIDGVVLLATFLPYLVEDRERLREQTPLAYGQLQQAPLPESARSHCLDV
jgi:hypothetical protein